jgi:N-acetylmuramoyl-L-alanine amidase
MGKKARMHSRKLAILLAVAAPLALPAAACADFVHIVSPGESLSSVAATDGLTVQQLAAANELPLTAELIAGTQLLIPPQSESFASQASASQTSEADSDADDASATEGEIATQASGEGEAAAPTSGEYVVQPGDTLSAIAARAGLTVSQLAAANRINPNALLLSGTTLTLDGQEVSSASSPSTPDAAASQPVGVAAEGTPGGPPYPTSEFVSPEEIGSIAAADGVPSSLAIAVAYMESGFNNAFTSSANARGVMQITPGTWSWIDRELAGSTPLQASSALGNVRAGVLLLRSLLDASGGNQELAIAGYYQGLPSVLQNGMYSSTRQYVSDVLALEGRF